MLNVHNEFIGLLEHENKKCRYYKVIDEDKVYFKKEYKEINSCNIELLKKEVEIINKLYMCNVPKIRNVNYEKCYIVYDYIEGYTLLNKRNISIYEKIILFKNILIELKKIHDSGIVHGDIKPSNIFYNDGVVTIIDFGVSCYENSKTSYASPMYCSIEQLKHEIIDRRSDIYSLGIMLYELITGCKMFEGYSQEQLNNKNENDIKKISNVNFDYLFQLNIIIEKCTYDIRDKRYSNVDEIIYEIDKILINYSRYSY